jgi:hypothetical protein
MTQIVFEGRTADPAIIYTAVIKACRVRAKNGSYILLSVISVPVNYAVRSSGPVTHSPPAVSGMVSDPTSSASPLLRQL